MLRSPSSRQPPLLLRPRHLRPPQLRLRRLLHPQGGLAAPSPVPLRLAPSGPAAAGALAAPADSDQKAALDKAIVDAQAARKKAASVGGEWRDTAKMIKQAEEAGAAGDFAKGLNLASEAQKQGELGYAQAVKEKGAGFPDYMTKQ